MSVLDRLLDGDPSVRWQALRDLAGAPPEVVAAERARVATEGWGADLLERQGSDGQWAGGACFPAGFDFDFSAGQPWTSTLPTLQLLRELGVDPADERVRTAVAAVRDGCRWEHDGQRFFDGEVEPCINGRTLAVGAYFGADPDAAERLVDRLLGEQLEDGGWNCETENGSVRSSFHTTICVLEGLLEHERSTGSTRSAAARERGEEYLLARGLLRRRSTGELVDEAWLRPAWPVWWHYDVLRGLDHLRAAGRPADPRTAEAVERVREQQQPDGTWLLARTHPGAVHVVMEQVGAPSRWTTLRALRVLAWSGAGPA